jgi:hypothetical protein
MGNLRALAGIGEPAPIWANQELDQSVTKSTLYQSADGMTVRANYLIYECDRSRVDAVAVELSFDTCGVQLIHRPRRQPASER